MNMDVNVVAGEIDGTEQGKVLFDEAITSNKASKLIGFMQMLEVGAEFEFKGSKGNSVWKRVA